MRPPYILDGPQMGRVFVVVLRRRGGLSRFLNIYPAALMHLSPDRPIPADQSFKEIKAAYFSLTSRRRGLFIFNRAGAVAETLSSRVANDSSV